MSSQLVLVIAVIIPRFLTLQVLPPAPPHPWNPPYSSVQSLQVLPLLHFHQFVGGIVMALSSVLKLLVYSTLIDVGIKVTCVPGTEVISEVVLLIRCCLSRHRFIQQLLTECLL